jgi:hypothetical protein
MGEYRGNMAQYTKWRKRAIPYDPMRGLRFTDIKVFRSSTSAEQSHKKGCDCRACQAYIALITRLNPARLGKIEGKDNAGLLPGENPIPLFLLRKRTEQEKRFAEERYRKESRGKSTPKWRG